MALPLAKLRLYLSLVPLLKRRGGVTFREIGEHVGMSEAAAAREIPEALMLCGVPPYLPHDYIACYTEGDRVQVKFADFFARPARLTLGEAAALLLTLRSLLPPRGAPEAPAVAGLIRKLEKALGSGMLKTLARGIGARRASSALGRRMALLHEAVEKQVEADLEYYTQRRRTLSKRRVRPYALIDHLGHFYLIARDSVRGKEISFRIDRIRSVALTDRRFEKPAGFSAQRYRKPELYKPASTDAVVRVRFAPEAAPYVREVSPPAELTERSNGALERAVRTDSLRWVVDFALQHGAHAEILGPAEARAETRAVLDAWLALYR